MRKNVGTLLFLSSCACVCVHACMHACISDVMYHVSHTIGRKMTCTHILPVHPLDGRLCVILHGW